MVIPVYGDVGPVGRLKDFVLLSVKLVSLAYVILIILGVSDIPVIDVVPENL